MWERRAARTNICTRLQTRRHHFHKRNHTAESDGRGSGWVGGSEQTDRQGSAGGREANSSRMCREAVIATSRRNRKTETGRTSRSSAGLGSSRSAVPSDSDIEFFVSVHSFLFQCVSVKRHKHTRWSQDPAGYRSSRPIRVIGIHKSSPSAAP